MVAKPTGNDAVMHHRLVGLVLEVRIPAALEVRSRPVLELLELFLGWPDLDAGLDAVGRQRACALESPLVKDLYRG
jgi:hypothetical protein